MWWYWMSVGIGLCLLSNPGPTLQSLCISLSPPLQQHQQEPLISHIVMYTQFCPKLKSFDSYLVIRCCLINTYDYFSIPFASSQEGPDIALLSSLPVLLFNTWGILLVYSSEISSQCYSGLPRDIEPLGMISALLWIDSQDSGGWEGCKSASPSWRPRRVDGRGLGQVEFQKLDNTVTYEG